MLSSVYFLVKLQYTKCTLKGTTVLVYTIIKLQHTHKALIAMNSCAYSGPVLKLQLPHTHTHRAQEVPGTEVCVQRNLSTIFTF